MIRRIEEISMNAWPGLRTIVLDGWVARFANGITRRANSVIPLYESNNNIEQKIALCEKLYSGNNLPAAFKMTIAACPGNLDLILMQKGYIREAETSVQTVSLGKRKFSFNNCIIINENINDEWINNFIKLSGHNSNYFEIFKEIISNIIIERCLFSLTIKGEIAGVGLGVCQDDFIGLFDIVIAETFRGKGYGQLIVQSIIHWGQTLGAKTAYLQVMTDNYPALKLYEKLGFNEEYKYWYRIKK